MGVELITEKVLTVKQCRNLRADGRLATDGSALVPLHLLWFRTRDVVAYADVQLGADLDAALRGAKLRPRDGKRCGAWDTMTRRDYVRFDTVDRMLTLIGLTVAFLGDPIFSPGPPTNPQLAELIA